MLKKYARVSLNLGLPIIRPLWMLDPNDSSCHTVADEFSIGEDIIVAPILYSRSREREVYLPAGRRGWIVEHFSRQQSLILFRGLEGWN